MGQAELLGDAARHLRRVLRAERGQRFEICDNRSVYLAEIDGFGNDAVSFRVLEELAEEPLPLRLALLASLIKFDRFEWILEKASELGVETILPVQAERSEKGLEKAAAKRLERWRRILLESSQQSRRTRLPEVAPPLRFTEALATPALHRYILEEQAGAPPFLDRLPGNRRAGDTAALLLGPEGGWTDAERATASQRGWMPVSLGPQILRAETAAIAAVAVLFSAWRLRTPTGEQQGKPDRGADDHADDDE